VTISTLICDHPNIYNMIEYNEAVQELIESLEDAAGERELTGNEKIFMDVVETVGVIFEDGLHEFWFSPVDQD